MALVSAILAAAPVARNLRAIFVSVNRRSKWLGRQRKDTYEHDTARFARRSPAVAPS
jgi:hypothetical protein